MYEQISANKRKTVLLMASFFALIGFLSWILAVTYANDSILVGSLVFAVGYAVIGYFASSRLALSINGAHEISKHDEPRLYRTIENLAITEGLPMPKVYIIQDNGMNAFATGRNPEHASVAITTGLLQSLTDTELEGVMAHELGHVKNYDIRVSMVAFALVGVISLLSDLFLRVSFWGGNSTDEDNKSSGSVLVILSIVALILAPIIATLLQLALSRKREYLADATGAMTTRYPEGLASALEKIEAGGSVLSRQNASTAHFFIANPLKGASFSRLFSTHPPIHDRVRILRAMTKEK